MDRTIWVHSISAVLALVIPLPLFWRIKGDRWHRYIGWTFTVLMLLCTVSSLFIKTFGQYSVIHLLSIFTLFNLGKAFYATRWRPHKWRYMHANGMASCYIALIIAGIGVIVRHGLLDGNVFIGGIASGIMAAVIIPVTYKMLQRYR